MASARNFTFLIPIIKVRSLSGLSSVSTIFYDTFGLPFHQQCPVTFSFRYIFLINYNIFNCFDFSSLEERCRGKTKFPSIASSGHIGGATSLCQWSETLTRSRDCCRSSLLPDLQNKSRTGSKSGKRSKLVNEWKYMH